MRSDGDHPEAFVPKRLDRQAERCRKEVHPVKERDSLAIRRTHRRYVHVRHAVVLALEADVEVAHRMRIGNVAVVDGRRSPIGRWLRGWLLLREGA